MAPRSLRYSIGFALFSLVLLALFAASAPQVSGSYAQGLARDISPLTPVPTCDVPSWQVIPSQNPSAYTNYLQGVSALSENDAWAVGYYNTSSGSPAYSLVERWNGSQWTSMTVPHVGSSSNRLAAVEAIAPNDVWAVGHYRYVTQPDPYDQTLILHWNGSQWDVIPSPNSGTWNNFLYSISAVSPTDIWAVGSRRTSLSAPEHTLIMHWDGSQWEIVQSPNLGFSYNILRGVTAISSNDVWAVGYYDAGSEPDQTLILHWNGSQWQIVPSANAPTGFSLLYSVDAASANDVWAVGYNSNPPGGQVRTLVQHWDGSSWTLVDSPNPGSTYNSLNGVSVVSSTDVWAIGNSNSGSGSQTLTLHWDGQAWTQVPSPNAAGGNWLNAVDAVSSRHVWAVGYSGSAGAYRTLALLYRGNDPCGTPGPANTATPAPTHTMQPNTATATGTPGDPEYAILAYVKDNNPTWNCQGPSGPPGHRRITYCIGSAGHVGDGAVDNYGSSGSAEAQWQSLRQAAQSYPIFGDTTFGNGYPGYYAGNNNYPYAHYEVNFWGSVWVMGATSSDDTHFRFAPHLANAIFNAARTLGYLPPNPPVETITPTASAIATATQTTPPTQGPTNTATATMITTSTIAATSVATTISTVTSTTTATPVVTATTTATAIVCAISFTDVPTGHTFYESIRCLACRGVVSGYADGTFKPDNLVTRGQLAKIVSNAANFTEDPGAQIFQDVAPDHTFYEWINRLTNRGYMGGYTCGSRGEPCVNNRPYFRPFANATRAQTSKIVANAARYNDPPTGQTFEDVPPTHPFYTEIQRLASRNIMGGYACGGSGEPCVPPGNRAYFRSYNDVTRGQSAKIVAGAFACSAP